MDATSYIWMIAYQMIHFRMPLVMQVSVASWSNMNKCVTMCMYHQLVGGSSEKGDWWLYCLFSITYKVSDVPLTVKIDEPQERIIYPSPSSDFNTLRIHSTYEGTWVTISSFSWKKPCRKEFRIDRKISESSCCNLKPERI
jgi:hypothetical protein